MDNHKKNIIKNIAQELDCGFDCYFNVKTEEIIAIPGSSYLSDQGDFKATFEKDIKKIETQKADIVKFNVLQSFEYFEIMENFTAQISDKSLQRELENILTHKRPFKNFKNRIDQSDFRQDWFDFKQKEIEKIVETELKTNKASAQHWL